MRGKAEFSIMNPMQMESHMGAPHGLEPDINARAPQRMPREPMKNLLSKGIKESVMRGSCGFATMKGFDMGLKEMDEEAKNSNAEVAEGEDVAKEEELSDKVEGKKEGEKGENEFATDEYTFDPELETVEEGAKRDVEDGYVSDAQGERVSEEKGYNRYNRMVEKGIAADIEINAFNVGQAMDDIATHSGMVIKEMDTGIEVKGAAQTAKKVAMAAGLGAGAAALTLGPSAAAGAVGAGKGKRMAGAMEGIKAVGRQLGHPIKSAKASVTGEGVEEFLPYASGKKLRESKSLEDGIEGKGIVSGAKRVVEAARSGAGKVGRVLEGTGNQVANALGKRHQAALRAKKFNKIGIEDEVVKPGVGGTLANVARRNPKLTGAGVLGGAALAGSAAGGATRKKED